MSSTKAARTIFVNLSNRLLRVSGLVVIWWIVSGNEPLIGPKPLERTNQYIICCSAARDCCNALLGRFLPKLRPPTRAAFLYVKLYINWTRMAERRIINMERPLLCGVVVVEAQPRPWRRYPDQKPQHNGPGRRQPCLLFIPARLTDRLSSLNDHALHASAILRGNLPCQFH
jgi:hypothetical protein